MKLFELFSKKKDTHTDETALTDGISVSNLKKYVVQGYEKEKELLGDIANKSSEILKLREQLRAQDALQVVLNKKESDIRKLEDDLVLAGEYKEYSKELIEKIDTLRIQNHNLEKEKEKILESIELQISEKNLEFSDNLLERFSDLVTSYKGNLSKQEAKNILEGLLYAMTKK